MTMTVMTEAGNGMIGSGKWTRAAAVDTMPTKGSSSTSDDSLHLSGELTTLQQEVAHCRRLAQQADERLRLAMDVGCLGIWNWSIPDNQITREGYHEELFGLAPGSFSGTYDDFLACLHPDDREAVQQEVARCLALRQDYRQEYRVRWPNGSVHWIEGRARIQCDEQGQPVRMMGVVQDISDRKLMEEQQVRFRALFDAAKDAVLIADDDRRYVEANPAAGELLGVVPEQIRDGPLMNLSKEKFRVTTLVQLGSIFKRPACSEVNADYDELTGPSWTWSTARPRTLCQACTFPF